VRCFLSQGTRHNDVSRRPRMEQVAMNNIEPNTIRANFSRLTAAQKPSRGAPLYSLMVNRPLGRVFAATAHRLGLAPNHVTVISAIFTFTGLVMIATIAPGWLAAVLITATLVIGYALDAADGQLARLRGGGTLTGEWLDHVIDALKTATLHLAVLAMFFRLELPKFWLIVALVFAATDVVHFAGMLLTDLLTRNAQARLGAPGAAPQNGSTLMSVLKLPTDYGVMSFSFLLLAVPVVFQWFYLALALANFVYLLLVLRVWYRRLGVLDHALAGRLPH